MIAPWHALVGVLASFYLCAYHGYKADLERRRWDRWLHVGIAVWWGLASAFCGGLFGMLIG